jgi:site-specific DNA-methyltransferase (adenine-specific)
MPVFDNRKLFDKEKVSKSLESTVWGTPPEIFNPLNKEFAFTLDVCAILENAKADRFFPPEVDGLSQSWKNNVCWCNPPYGKDIVKWCKKALKETEDGATTVMLIPCKTNTNWWHDFVIPFAEIRFLRGRVKFIQNGIQSTQALPWPLAIVIYKAKRQA